MDRIIAFLTSTLWLLIMLNIENISEMFDIDEVFLTYIMLFIGLNLILFFVIIANIIYLEDLIEEKNNER